MNARIPPGAIQSLSNTIMEGVLSVAVELLSQRIDELTQVICTEQIISTDLRTDFSELQKRVNSSTFLFRELLLSGLWVNPQGQL